MLILNLAEANRKIELAFSLKDYDAEAHERLRLANARLSMLCMKKKVKYPLSKIG